MHRIGPPSICAAFAENAGGNPRDFGIENRLAARRANNRRNRRPPRALTRNAPLGMRLEHLRDAFLPPRGCPLHAADVFDRARAQPVLVHGDEPLRGSAEDHGVVAAPAMRIAVFEVGVVEQRAACAEILDDLRVGFPNVHAGVRSRFARENAARIHRIDDREIVFHARLEVVRTVPGRRVHRAGSGFHVDVVGQHHRGIAIHEWMADRQSFQRASFGAADSARAGKTLA